MITADQKNINILNRFETKDLGSKIKTFRLVVNGRSMTCLDMNNASLDEMKRSALNKFGRELESVHEI